MGIKRAESDELTSSHVLLLPCCLHIAPKMKPTEEDALTEDSLAAFVASWDAGELETKEFNLPARPEGEDVAGDDASE